MNPEGIFVVIVNKNIIYKMIFNVLNKIIK